MDDRLNLIIGKPALEIPECKDTETGETIKSIEANVATYTRFTLPFAFQLQACSLPLKTNTLFYELDDKEDLSYIKRRKYFTRETADTLYERGQWLSICDNWVETAWGKAEISITLRGQEFKIGMLAPQLILFETPEIKQEKQRNILQTGVLYIDVYFPENQTVNPQLDDLLVLNEYFRYFGIPNDNHAKNYRKDFSEIPIDPEKKETIASLGNLECYFERWASLLEIPIKYKSKYYHLFPKDWAKGARAWMYNKSGSNNLDHWQIYADNRCYVWTAVFIKDGATALKHKFYAKETTIKAKEYGHWIKLLNVDNPSFNLKLEKQLRPIETHHQVSQFEQQWADERTYKRWEQTGAFYGFCYHSAAILAPPYPYIFSPSATYYFDTTALLFYIRMSLFRFGRELSKVIVIKNEDDKREELKGLRNEFATFTVLYRFPMPSNQQQSIEMYEINRKFFDLDNFFEEIQQEIDNTHNFLETVEANELASAANKLANWGIPLAAGGLLAALFSMEDFNLWQCRVGTSGCQISWDLLIQAGLVTGLFFVIKYFFRWKKNK